MLLVGKMSRAFFSQEFNCQNSHTFLSIMYIAYKDAKCLSAIFYTFLSNKAQIKSPKKPFDQLEQAALTASIEDSF